MNRRKAIKSILTSSIGLTTLGFWSTNSSFLEELLSNSFLTAEEQNLLTSIADTIIPKTNLYGAVDLGVPLYLIGYIEECVGTEEQQNIKLQLKQLQKRTQNVFNKKFIELDQKQREQILLDFTTSSNEKEHAFFSLLKDQTIRGFKTTEKVMTEHYNYRVIPGHYRGNLNVLEKSVS